MNPDEHTKKIAEYITHQLQSGIPADTIATHLRGANWPEEHIQQAFQLAQSNFLPQSAQPPAQPVLSAEPVAEPAQIAQPEVTQAESQPVVAGSDPQVQALVQGGTAPQAASTKKGRIRNGWLLFKQSYAVLRGNPGLLRYMLMTGLWTFVVNVILIILYIVFDQKDLQGDTATLSPLGYILGFFDYLIIYFLINYYAAGLTATILDIFQGQHKTYKDYMKVARSKAKAIFIFSLISATVGFVLQYVVERIRYVGWIIAWLLGTAWSLGTLFVIPIIVSEEKPGGAREIKQSMQFFKQTWGENITTKLSVNTPLFLINILLVFGYLILLFAVLTTLGFVGVIILTIIFWLAIFCLAILGSFANSVVNVALYYFAVYHQAPPAFDAELLNKVFISHKKRRFFGKNKNAQAS